MNITQEDLSDHDRKTTVTAIQMALKDVCAHPSCRMEMRRWSMSQPKRVLDEVVLLAEPDIVAYQTLGWHDCAPSPAEA